MNTNNQRSPLTLKASEILVIVLAIIVAELCLYYGLQWTGPYFPDAMEHNDPMMVRKRQELFSAFAFPLGIVVPISALSLIRGIRMDVRHFSRLGHFSSALPLLISVLLGVMMTILTPACITFLVLASLITALITASRTLWRKRDFGDLLAIPLNMGWGVFYWIYLDRWIEEFIW